MFYFVPAWYHQDKPWNDPTPLWFRVYEKMSFDDTVNQYKMFESGSEKTGFLILHYQPHLRYALHKQGLLQAENWSFFDDIQNIQTTSMQAIDFKMLNWPKGVRFIYTPFAVVVKKDEEMYAIIHFAENGNLFYIETYQNGQIEVVYYFDDRGFVSSLLYYQDGHENYRDYLNESGVWQVREYLGEQIKLVINPDADHIFEKREYDSWESLMIERLRKFKLQNMSPSDVLIIASHLQHNNLFLDIFPENKKIFSFFGQRYPYNKQYELLTIYLRSEFIVVDTDEQEKLLVEQLNFFGFTESHQKIKRLSPFDTRLRLGSSQNLKELVIHFFMDGISEEAMKQYLLVILGLMEENPLIELSLVTFQQHVDVKWWIDYIRNTILEHYTVENFFEPQADEAGENQLDEDLGLALKRIVCECYINENQLITALDRTRLVIDLGDKPDLYTQIASISAGIPQINKVKTDYVTHLKNGWIIQDVSDLKLAILYYFDGLKHWNQSLVYAVQKMADFTSGRLLKQWKTYLKVVEEE